MQPRKVVSAIGRNAVTTAPSTNSIAAVSAIKQQPATSKIVPVASRHFTTPHAQSPRMPEGVVEMSNAQYHADRTAYSSTQLKELLKSGLALQDYLENGRTETPEMRLGTAVHTALLESDRFNDEYMVIPDFGTGKMADYKKKEFEQKHNGKAFLLPREAEFIRNVQLAFVSKSFMQKLLTHPEGEAEQSMFWQEPDTGLRFKCRIDYLIRSIGVVLDLKTCVDATKYGFRREVERRDYDLSAYLYKMIADKVLQQNNEFSFLAIPKKGPLDLVLYRCSDATLKRGRDKFMLCVDRLLAHRRSGQWHGADDGEDFVDL